AVKVMFEGMLRGLFTGKKLADYIDGIEADFVEDRHVVNGTDEAHRIAGYAKSFVVALKAANYSALPSQPPVQTPPPVSGPVTAPRPESAPAAKLGWIAAIAGAGLAAWGWAANLPCDWLGVWCG